MPQAVHRISIVYQVSGVGKCESSSLNNGSKGYQGSFELTLYSVLFIMLLNTCKRFNQKSIYTFPNQIYVYHYSLIAFIQYLYYKYTYNTFPFRFSFSYKQK